MIKTKIKDTDLVFNTADNLFSPVNIDKGTLAMLSVVDFNIDDKVLDLGCGYGVVGILSAKLTAPDNVVMVDIDENAVEMSKKNAATNNVEGIRIYQSDGFKNVNENDFTLIMSNPPYHEDFSVPKQFIEKGFNRLKVGGRFYMVTKREKWYKNKLTSIFGGVKMWYIDGYYVFMSIKRDKTYATKLKKSKS